jgi:alpha-amylase
VKLANSHLALYLHPFRGGHLYEFDLRDIDFNAGDTFARRFEAYHEKVARAVVGKIDSAASIHDMVIAKQPGLAELLKYDTYLRESLVDHFSAEKLSPPDFFSGNPPSDVGFRQGPYDLAESSSGRRTSVDKAAVAELQREAPALGSELRVTKRVTLGRKAAFDAEYIVENAGSVPVDGYFSVEMNYSLLAGDAHDRYYCYEGRDNAGKLATLEDFGQQSWIALKDHWLNVALTLKTSIPAQVLVSPVRTVSQSEAGFEAVYQSSAVVMQWPLKLGAGKSFAVKLQQEAGRVRAE